MPPETDQTDRNRALEEINKLREMLGKAKEPELSWILNRISELEDMRSDIGPPGSPHIGEIGDYTRRISGRRKGRR